MDCASTLSGLYDQLLAMPGLHSMPELEGDALIWRLYGDAYVYVYSDGQDVCIDFVSDRVYGGSLYHWHPDHEDLLEILYTLGKKGNIVVIGKSLLATQLLYMGAPEGCPLPNRRGWHWGTKKWAGGRRICLEQRP